MDKLAVLEGILFVMGDEGITIDKLCDTLELEKGKVLELINSLKKLCSNENRGLAVKFISDSIKLTTKNEHKEYYKRLLENDNYSSLSQQAIEILAIVAYNEPITRIEIDDIRGVNSAYTIRKLCARGLIKECGKSSLIGKPMMYKTTNDFLDCFGLVSLDELPKLEEVKDEKIVETDLFESKYEENK